MTDSERLGQLIDYQKEWVRQLTEQQAQLEKYCNGTLPANPRQVAQIAKAQAETSKAVRNIANVIREHVKRTNRSGDQST